MVNGCSFGAAPGDRGWGAKKVQGKGSGDVTKCEWRSSFLPHQSDQHNLHGAQVYPYFRPAVGLKNLHLKPRLLL